jgi:cold shock CspA family protein
MSTNGIRKGVVKYFTGSYGMITPDDGGREVFCPKQVLIFLDLGMLYPNDRVLFKSTQSPTEPDRDVIRWMAMDDGRTDATEATVIQARRGGLR